MGAVGVAAVAWPFIDQMNPSSAALALSSVEVDLTSIQVGQGITVKWRGQPLFVRRRTPAEIAAISTSPTAPPRPTPIASSSRSGWC
jgi:ubiquinol-cytochrome c reductase iron-sulfur subunit